MQILISTVICLTFGTVLMISVPEEKGEKVVSDTGYIDLNHSPECRVTHVCQICGKGTRSMDFILCDECREALRKMIYGKEKKNDSTDRSS